MGEKERETRRLTLPARSAPAALPESVTAAVAGLAIGLLAVGLTNAAMSGCDAIRGTSSCGGPGVVVLLAILVVLVIGGARLLRLLGVADPGTTAFLAVSLASLLAMLFLLDALTSPWMLLGFPILTALCFVLSQWVTRTFVDAEK